MRKEAAAYLPRLTAEKALAGGAAAAAVDSPQAAVRKEEDKEAQDTVQDSTGLSREEAAEAAVAVAVAEEALARAAAVAAVPAWAARAVPSWTYLQSSGPPLRRQLRHPRRALQSSP